MHCKNMFRNTHPRTVFYLDDHVHVTVITLLTMNFFPELHPLIGSYVAMWYEQSF